MVTGKAFLRGVCGAVIKAMAGNERLVLSESKGKINPFWMLERHTNS